MSNKVRLILINLVGVLKPLMLSKDSLHSLFEFEIQKFKFQSIQQPRMIGHFTGLQEIIFFLSGSDPCGHMRGFWSLHALSLSFMICCVIKYPMYVFKFISWVLSKGYILNAKWNLCFNIWISFLPLALCYQDTQCQCYQKCLTWAAL